MIKKTNNERGDILSSIISEGDAFPILMLYTFRKGNKRIIFNATDMKDFAPNIDIRFYPIHDEDWFVNMDLFEISLSERFYKTIRDDDNKIRNFFTEIISKITSLGADAAMIKYEDVFMGPNDFFNEWDATQTFVFGNTLGKINMEFDRKKRKTKGWQAILNSYMQDLKRISH